MNEAPPGRSGPQDDTVRHCLNCDAELSGRFCASCGQPADALRQPVRRFVAESFTELFGVDGRFWRSFGLLLFRPGRLTNHFLAGRRHRYVRPLRMYLFASLGFFFLITLIDPVGRSNPMTEAEPPSEPRTVETRLDEIDGELERAASSRERFAESEGNQVLFAQLDALSDELHAERATLAAARPDSMVIPAASALVNNVVRLHAPLAVRSTGLPEWLPKSPAVQRVEAAGTWVEWNEAMSELLRSTIKRFATMMFVMLPLFALLLKVAYARRDWYYSEHLVFALHVHAFSFVILGFAMLASSLAGSSANDMITSLVFLALVGYFLVAQRVVYRQSVVKGFLKSFVVGFLYLNLLSLGVFGALALAAALG